MDEREPEHERRTFRPVEGIALHTPEYLIAWVKAARDAGIAPKSVLDFRVRLATDKRMSEFWDWFAATKDHRSIAPKNALVVADKIWRAAHLPGKPGNMTPAARDSYFEKIRKHAGALMNLLADTRFDGGGFQSREMSDFELSKSLRETLYDWGIEEEEDGHIVAFRVSPDGRFRSDMFYPAGELTANLSDLIGWTTWNDQWDGDIFGTSAPIVQSKGESRRLVYFTCMLFDTLMWEKVEIPFPILASVANVALELGPDEQADEDTVRKQVRRYQARRAKEKSLRPYAFEEETGQSSSNLDDSVLSDPF